MTALIPALIQHLNQHHATLHAAVAAIPPELRDVTPPTGGWSVAQVVEHLALVTHRFFGMLERAIAAAPAGANDISPVEVLRSRKVLAALDRNTRVEAQDIVVPNLGWDAAYALATFDEAHRKLVEVVAGAEGKTVTHLRHTHYILGEMTLLEWIGFAGTHEARHAAQIVEIGVALGCLPTA